jgi:hypothetical protein
MAREWSVGRFELGGRWEGYATRTPARLERDRPGVAEPLPQLLAQVGREWNKILANISNQAHGTAAALVDSI